MGDVHERFAEAFAQVVAVRKAQKNFLSHDERSNR